jgi:CRP-like cAMP-binding protein
MQMLRQLERFPWFEGLSPDQVNVIGEIVSARHYNAGETIFAQGEKASELYLLIEGSVSVRYKPYDGEMITLNHIHAGGVFGWSAIMGTKYTAGTICDTDSEVWAMRGSDIQALCKTHPATGEAILDRLAQAVSGRWKNSQDQVRSMLQKGVRAKGEKKMIPSEKQQQIQALLDQLSAYIEQFHGGSVEFVSFNDPILTVKLGGACLGCPLSPVTLHGWVEGTVRQFFPEVKVEAA